MAEGFIRQFAGDRFDAFSAGTKPTEAVHPLAVQVMAEVGIDISGQRPKDVKEYLGRLSARYLIVVCSGADQECPRIFPGVRNRLYWPFDDPSALSGSDDEILSGFRLIRDQIRDKVDGWIESAEPALTGQMSGLPYPRSGVDVLE
jgi:arsenate reductase